MVKIVNFWGVVELTEVVSSILVNENASVIPVGSVVDERTSIELMELISKNFVVVEVLIVDSSELGFVEMNVDPIVVSSLLVVFINDEVSKDCVVEVEVEVKGRDVPSVSE
jgi:hypothetical protein